ncbi:polycystin-1-like protein 2 isoform X1 [Gadus macrocephalus]|uniref:polycystin-1-like protein 2 isoform X1 n=1 Tax=Gadus macrocephalus TaxID=80720 RepID=UPI0028CBB621|nr:polycystin-1-like protein 2 isoform X1 [Gadus macrocephalus]
MQGLTIEMADAVFSVMLLMSFSLNAVSYAQDLTDISCPDSQEAFDGSCYELVALQRPFLNAESWCERGGGHLAFILNDETQQFLQKHLDPGKDWWLGLAPAAPNLTLDSTAGNESSLSWLDGSDISYNNWVTNPHADSACGHVLRNSGFQWEAKVNCSQDLNFICQFDSGRSIACDGLNATLQCGSGQVIEIDDSFYGRKTIHYCKSKETLLPASSEEDCSWIDVVDPVKGHCHGLQACQAIADVGTFGEPCPEQGSYLSVEYHCKDGLNLLMSKLAAVSDNVNITVKWLLHPFEGNLTCTLNAGDGHNIDSYTPEEVDSSVMHKYSKPGVFTVGVECTTSDWHVTAQRVITIQESVGEFGVITCYSQNLSTEGTACQALYGTPLQLHVVLEAGTNVNLEIQSRGTVLANFSSAEGAMGHNITVSAEVTEQLGPGCHDVTLHASNAVTPAGVSTELRLCLVEPVDGLKASAVAEEDACPLDTSDLALSVSLESGAPAELLFSLASPWDNRTETREMLNASLQEYHFSDPIRALREVTIKATNLFSAAEVDVDLRSLIKACKNNSDCSADDDRGTYQLEISATPDPAVDHAQSIRLTGTGADALLSKQGMAFKWSCDGNCRCKDVTHFKGRIIRKHCLPNPFEMLKYTFTVKRKTWFRNCVVTSASKCITVTPKEFTDVTISCPDCASIDVDKPVELSLTCVGTCPEVVWNIEDPKAPTGELQDCYTRASRRPLIETQDGNTSYTVHSQRLNEAKDAFRNITVIAYGKTDPGFAMFTFPILSVAPTAASSTTTSQMTSVAAPDPSPSCVISPLSGTVLDTFDISCKTSFPCTANNCLYCLKTKQGQQLRCSDSDELKSVSLPLGDKNNNYSLTMVVTVKNGDKDNDMTITTQVRKSDTGSSVDSLQAAVTGNIAQLEAQGLLRGAVLGQMFSSISDMLNADATDDQKGARLKLREQMLSTMTSVLLDSPSNSSQEVYVTAKAVAGLTKISDELSPSAQVEASSLLADLSSSLLSINVYPQDGDEEEVLEAATPIVEAVSNILNVSPNKIVSDILLTGMNNVQSALLNGKEINEGPVIISSGHISLYVNRVSPKNIQMQSIASNEKSSSQFIFPLLPVGLLSPEEPVDVRMMSFERNPYPGEEANITGTVGSVSLTKLDGTTIPVENLPNEIEIILPRLEEEQQISTLLDLGNFSTLMIDVPSPEVTLVLRIKPSENISFKLLLGFGGYPSEEDHVAQIQMPLEGSPEEESYIWVLGPEERKGHVGLHYLVVKPIVGAGVTSINATVSVSSIAAQCKFWNDSTSAWSENGCRVGPLTTSLVTQCLCNHLTLFGSSFFVMPNMVDVSRTAELFATFTTNPVVVCFVGAIFVVYLLVAIWARRKDIQDLAKVKITVLDDNDPFAEYRYMLTVNTGHRRGASTSSQVAVTLQGEEGESEPHHLTDSEKPVFERGGMDMFLLTTPFSIGELQSIRVWHDNSGEHPAWYINKVMVQDLETGQKWHFLCNSWLSIDMGECTLDKVFPVATEMDLKKFSNLFFMKTAKDFRDGHIWFSVISRPPCSTFTRVQRVSCCFSLLLCTMLTSIMFWGIPTDPSEQTMDLGHIEFTWQQVMIGFQSSIIMFPINVLIVSIFRNTRPRQRTAQTDASKQGKSGGRVGPSQTSPQKQLKDISPDTVMKDIKRIAQSLSKAMKSPLPALELRSGQPADINTLLSLVEDIIRKQNRVGGEFYSDASKKEASMILTLGAVNLQETNLCGSPEKTADGVQKMSSNSQYLYRQLRHVEKELCLLGASRFPDPGGYSRAVQQVQGMKGLLEYHLPSSSQPPCPSSPEESLHGDGGAKGKCCQGGLPWWFVFVGWTLVVATSGVSGYFTMMYGLTYGKDRSISWLISMVVSFVESLFITQPLKVLGFAAFFALVLKKVDQEEYGEPQVEDTRRTSDDPDAVRTARRDSDCSFYQPPPPTDIERMKSNMIKEQKVYALIKEILAYAGFMWMLLLVAYGQRDPNAYFLSRHIQRSFSQGISDTMSIGDVFVWANTSLLKNIFGSHAGFITDGNSKLVGNARLRQVRVQNNTCQIDKSMRSGVPDCHAPYSWDVEDMGSYGPSWGPSGSDNASEGLSSPWKYQSQARLKALPLWGSVRLYRGGGFVVDLVASIQNSTRTLGYLFDNTWLDVYTQALFVEFTVYNANVNLFCLVTLMLETTGIGAFQFRSELQTIRLYQSAGGLHIFVMASEAIYFLFIFYYMVIQGKLMKQHSWAYFRNKWNLLELAIILLSWSALSVFIKRTLLGNRDMAYYQTHKNQFPSFHETATADAVLGYLIAFLVLLATIKLWHLMRLNPKLHMITATLQRAWTDISGFLVVITIMFLAYSIASNLLYGWKMYSYRTLLDSALTMVSLQLGIFNYDEVLNYNPLLGGFLIGSCIVFMTFVVLNLFISVILVAFTQEQIHHKPSEEEEIVDLMLMKLCSLFGIKFKTKGGPSQDTVVSSSSKNGVSMISSNV